MVDRKGLLRAAEAMADFLKERGSVLIVGHIDSDGITSACVASTALERQGVDHEVRFVKKLDPPQVEMVNRAEHDAVWLVDLGSGAFPSLTHPGVCISDHHVPDRRKGQNTLDSFVDLHVNPHFFGMDGSTEISGAGTTYCVARAMDPSNRDLSHLALVGAVGDFQEDAQCRLVGFNREILEDAREEGLVECREDLRIYGKESRPLSRLLMYSNDPYLPGITNCHPRQIDRFFFEIGVPPRTYLDRDGKVDTTMKVQDWVDDKEVERDTRARYWYELDEGERQAVILALRERLGGKKGADRLVGEIYHLTQEEQGSAFHDAKEFATVLNSCGRYERAELGMRACWPDEEGIRRQAISLLSNHRNNIRDALSRIVFPWEYGEEGQIVIDHNGYLWHFNAGPSIRDTVIGIVAGMVLSSRAGTRSDPGELADFRERLPERAIPVVAFADSEGENGEELLKVSARGTRELVSRGLDLSSAIKLASERVGGVGGGHNIAAGATIDKGKEEEFLREMTQIIQDQLGLS